MSPEQGTEEQRRVVWSRLYNHRVNLAKRLSTTKERYLAARRELNPNTTQVESSHNPLYRDNRGPPGEDDKATALVSQLNQIQQLDSEPSTQMSSLNQLPHATPPVHCHSQVTVSTVSSCARVCQVASGLVASQQPHTHDQWGAGSQAHQMGTRVPQIAQGVHIGAELSSTSVTRRVETLPPLGFYFNQGANFIPCIITDNTGRSILAQYTRVIMGPNPHVVGIIPGDCSQYSGPQHAVPDHNQGKCPRYAYDDLWCLKYGTDKVSHFDSTLEFIHDLSLTAKVPHFQESSCLFTQYQEDICKLEEHMWEAGQLKDTSSHRLEEANTLHRIKEAVVELNRRAVGQQALTEHGCST